MKYTGYLLSKDFLNIKKLNHEILIPLAILYSIMGIMFVFLALPVTLCFDGYIKLKRYY